MSNYLPRNVRVGQTVSVRLRLGKDTESERGEIIEIPSHRRFAVVRFCFPVKGLFGVELERSFCECFPIMLPPLHEAELDAYGGAEGEALLDFASSRVKPNSAITPSGAVQGCGDKLRSLRKLCGYTQQRCAKQLGVAQTRWSDWEQNIRPIPKGRLQAIADCFGCSIQVFTGPA